MNTTLFVIFGTIGFVLLVTVVIVLIITHQKKVWAEQNKLQEFKLNQQKEQMHAIIEAQELERHRIAQDLHDEIGGLAQSLKINNNYITDVITNPEELKKIKEKNEAIANNIIETGRNVSHDLLPPIIKNSGLIEALRALAKDMNDVKDLEITFTSNEEHVDLGPTAEISLYRIVKEWINNVKKHAEATLLELNIELKSSAILLQISDNGKGFDFEKAKANSQGMGLMNIEGRLNYLNAHFSFSNTEKKGTLFSINHQLK